MEDFNKKLEQLKSAVINEIKSILPEGKTHVYQDRFGCTMITGETAPVSIAVSICNDGGKVILHDNYEANGEEYDTELKEYEIETIICAYEQLRKELRAEKIRNAARVRDQKIQNDKDRVRNLLQSNMDKVKSLAPRIKQLMVVANELKRNGFPLGKRSGSPVAYEESVSDGWYHRPGFVLDREGHVIGIGVIGGGCCGEDIVFNENGDCIKQPRCGANAEEDAIHKSNRLISAFDSFEETFYAYVDSL